jgi:hypothetical protein
MNANPAHMFFCGSIPLEHEVDVFNALAEIGGELPVRRDFTGLFHLAKQPI